MKSKKGSKPEHIVDIVNYTCDDLIYMPVGYVRQMADILREQSKERPGLYFAGEYVSGAQTGCACASGRSVARQIAQHWASGSAVEIAVAANGVPRGI